MEADVVQVSLLYNPRMGLGLCPACGQWELELMGGYTVYVRVHTDRPGSLWVLAEDAHEAVDKDFGWIDPASVTALCRHCNRRWKSTEEARMTRPGNGSLLPWVVQETPDGLSLSLPAENIHPETAAHLVMQTLGGGREGGEVGG